MLARTTLVVATVLLLSACQSGAVTKPTDSSAQTPSAAEPSPVIPGDTTAKTIVVLMDGTWNEPDDLDDGGYPQQDSTNVEKLRYLLSRQNQTILYFPGVGTDGNIIWFTVIFIASPLFDIVTSFLSCSRP